MKSINRRECVIDALAHKNPSSLPYFLEFTAQARDRMAAFMGDSEFEDKLGCYIHYTQYWGWPTEIEGKPGYFKDSFGVIWNRSGVDKDIGVIDKPIIEDITDYNYQFPPIDEARLRVEYENLVKTKDDKFTIIGIGFSTFERFWSLCGFENSLINMALYPTETEELFNAICDYNLRVMDIGLQYDVDGFYFGDDWGQQNGLIMGLPYWRRFIKPCIARMYDKAHKAGKYVFQHSCGDCRELMTDLIEIGLDCYQTFQPEIYDIAGFKAQYGDRLAVWGGISTQQLLTRAKPQEVYDVTRKTIEIMAQSGGYIAAPTHALTHDIPPENVMAMLKAIIER